MTRVEQRSWQLPVSVKVLSTLILLGCGVFGVIGLVNFSKIKTHYSATQFLPRRSPILRADARIQHQFHLDKKPTFIGLIKMGRDERGTWLTPGRMKKLDRLTHSVSNLYAVKQVISLSTVTGAAEAKGAITVGPLTKLTPPAMCPNRFLHDPLISPTLITKDARTATVVVQLKNSDMTQMKRFESSFRAQMQKQFPHAEVKVGGIPAIQSDLEKLLTRELRNFILLSLVACALTLLLIFRTLSSLFIPLALTILANLVVIAAMAWQGLTFTILSSTIPILVFITVVALSVHIMLRVREDAQLADPNETKLDLIFRSCRAIWLPNLLGALTTCIGFLTLLSNDVQLIQDYGFAVAVAVMISWLVTSVAILPLMLLLPIPEPRSWVSRPARWELWFLRRSHGVVFKVTVACLALIVIGSKLDWTARLFDDLPKGQEARQTTEHIDRAMGGMIPLELVVHAKSHEAWNDPVQLKHLDLFLHKIRSIKGVGTARSLPDFLRSSHLSEGKALPASRAAVAEAYFLYSLDAANPLRYYLSDDGTSARVEIRLRDLPADQLTRLCARLKVIAHLTFPQDQIKEAGLAISVPRLNNTLSKGLIFGFWQALVAIAIMLMFVFRSLRWALVACVPNLIPPLALLGFLALTHTPIKPGVAIIFSIALGLAFNNTVYVLNRLRVLMKNKNHLPVLQTFYLEGNPCLVSTLIVMVGFSVFLFSYFSLNRTFGFCMLVSILAGVLGDLIFLPALLRRFPRLLGKQNKVAPPPPAPQVDWDHLTPTDWNKAIAASIALIFVMAFPVHKARAATMNRAEVLLRHSLQHLKCRDEVATGEMTIIEADGASKKRKIEIKRKTSGHNQRVMARLLSPPDLRGMAFLSVIDKKGESQWIYFPSSKQVRRVVGASGAENGILGSELTYEDLNPAAIRTSHVQWLRTDVVHHIKLDVIKILLEPTKSHYKLALMWIEPREQLPLRIEYFDKHNHAVKTITFDHYHRYGSAWRAQAIKVKNLRNKRRTNVVIDSLRTNTGLADDDLSTQAMSDN